MHISNIGKISTGSSEKISFLMLLEMDVKEYTQDGKTNPLKAGKHQSEEFRLLMKNGLMISVDVLLLQFKLICF